MGGEFGLITAIGVIIIVLTALLLVLVIAGYVFSSIGLYAMARKRSQANKAFWAWIPFGRLYLMGLLARDTSVHDGTKTYLSMHILLPVATAAADVVIAVLGMLNVPLAGSLLALVIFILYLVCLYGLLKGYDTKNAAGMHVALSVFIPLYSSILLFVFRNRPFLFDDPGGDGSGFAENGK